LLTLSRSSGNQDNDAQFTKGPEYAEMLTIDHVKAATV
jgi:hypothetical protein